MSSEEPAKGGQQKLGKTTAPDRRIEAAALHMLDQGHVGIVFSAPVKIKREGVISGKFFTWKEDTPPTLYKARSLKDIHEANDTITVEVNGTQVTVPTLVHEVCSWIIREDALGQEGLIRKSGGASRIRALAQHLDGYGRLPTKQESTSIFTCHDMAQILKTFLRLLPGGVADNLYKSVITTQRFTPGSEQAASLGPAITDAQLSTHRTAMMNALCFLLPKESQDVLRYVLNFMVSHVIPAQEAASHNNPMTLDSIAKVLGPTLFPSGKKVQEDDPEEIAFIVSAARSLLEEYKKGRFLNPFASDVMTALVKTTPKEKAAKTYKEKFENKKTKVRRRRRSSGLGLAVKAGAGVIRTLQRKSSRRRSSSSGNKTEDVAKAALCSSQRSKSCQSLLDEMKAPSEATEPAPISSNQQTPGIPTTSSPHKRTGADMHAREDMATLKRPKNQGVVSGISASNALEDDDNETPYEDDVLCQAVDGTLGHHRLQTSEKFVSAVEASKTCAHIAVIDPRQKRGEVNLRAHNGIGRRQDRPQQRRRRSRSVEAARRLSGNITESAKKAMKFMNNSFRKSARRESSGETIEAESLITCDDTKSKGEEFLSIISQTSNFEGDVVSPDEWQSFQQLCFETHQKIESLTSTILSRAEAGCAQEDCLPKLRKEKEKRRSLAGFRPHLLKRSKSTTSLACEQSEPEKDLTGAVGVDPKGTERKSHVSSKSEQPLLADTVKLNVAASKSTAPMATRTFKIATDMNVKINGEGSKPRLQPRPPMHSSGTEKSKSSSLSGQKHMLTRQGGFHGRRRFSPMLVERGARHHYVLDAKDTPREREDVHDPRKRAKLTTLRSSAAATSQKLEESGSTNAGMEPTRTGNAHTSSSFSSSSSSSSSKSFSAVEDGTSVPDSAKGNSLTTHNDSIRISTRRRIHHATQQALPLTKPLSLYLDKTHEKSSHVAKSFGDNVLLAAPSGTTHSKQAAPRAALSNIYNKGLGPYTGPRKTEKPMALSAESDAPMQTREPLAITSVVKRAGIIFRNGSAQIEDASFV